jgi:predicted transposase/invertase (TIGR01784 family)
MLLSEWNIDEAKEVWLEGWKQGWKEGWRQGLEEGRKQAYLEFAKTALSKGIPVEVVQELTGLDVNTIAKLASNCSAGA